MTTISIANLSNEVLLQIFRYLTSGELKTAMQVCMYRIDSQY